MTETKDFPSECDAAITAMTMLDEFQFLEGALCGRIDAACGSIGR
jgi:hypothetical protein